MNKYTLQEITNNSFKNDILIHPDGSISSNIQNNGNFIIKQFYPLNEFEYTDDENYRISFLALKNNLTKEEYLSILKEERNRVLSYFEQNTDKIVNKKLEKRNKSKEIYLEKLRNLVR